MIDERSKKVNRDVIVALFQDIRAAFPHLEMDLQLEHRELDLNMDIPEQAGLVCGANLNLQGDELHFSVGKHFWLEWIPAYNDHVVGRFHQAVCCWLRGDFRVLEHYHGTRCVKAELQAPEDSAAGWQTIGTWSTFALPFGGGAKTTKELLNPKGGPR